jgi:hypothetical protein
VEDVAGEDHPEGESGDQYEGGQRVVAVARAFATREETHAERDERRRGAGAKDGGEAEAVGQHESGKGRRADGVRVERQPAQHDPGSDDPGGHGQDQDLHHPALDERQLKRLEHWRPRLQE